LSFILNNGAIFRYNFIEEMLYLEDYLESKCDVVFYSQEYTFGPRLSSFSDLAKLSKYLLASYFAARDLDIFYRHTVRQSFL
jgi:hypothetical protein